MNIVIATVILSVVPVSILLVGIAFIMCLIGKGWCSE